MRYFQCLVDTYENLRIGLIYPGDYKVNEAAAAVSLIRQLRPDEWQEVTEADYLAQQDLLDEFDRHVEGGMKAIQKAPTLGDAFDSMDKVVSDFGITKIAKPINEYHDALDAIGQGRIKEIPKHLFNAILAELVEEDKRRWAVENGYVEG